MQRLQDNICLVTGAAQGIGEAIARLFAFNAIPILFVAADWLRWTPTRALLVCGHNYSANSTRRSDNGTPNSLS
jgi:NAD(P)-dependent dehydrogenase (short-subunit alcohol dehydrogenase family)